MNMFLGGDRAAATGDRADNGSARGADFGEVIDLVWRGSEPLKTLVKDDLKDSKAVVGTNPWTKVDGEALNKAFQSGNLTEYLGSLGIEVNKGIREGTLGDQLKEFFRQDTVKRLNGEVSLTLKELLGDDPVPEQLKDKAEKTVGELWKEVHGEERPVLSESATESEIGDYIYKAAAFAAKLIVPEMAQANEASLKEFISRSYGFPDLDPRMIHSKESSDFVKRTLDALHDEAAEAGTKL